MKKTFCVFAVMLFAAIVCAQTAGPSVISPASGSGKTSTFFIDWTLGENAVETVYSSNLMYTQGFNQPNLIVTPLFSKKKDGEKSTYDISIAPNPVLTTLNLSISSTTEMGVYINVADANGKLYIQKKLEAKIMATQLDFSRLAAGTYIVSVRKTSNSELIKSYQIIKL